MVNASKAEFTYHVLQNVVVCCSVITAAKCLAQRTAHHVLKNVKTVAPIVNAKTNVGCHVKNARNLANGSADISSARSYVVRFAIGSVVTDDVEIP